MQIAEVEKLLKNRPEMYHHSLFCCHNEINNNQIGKRDINKQILHKYTHLHALMLLRKQRKIMHYLFTMIEMED